MKEFLKDFLDDPMEYAGQAVSVIAAIAFVIYMAVYFFKDIFK